MYFFLKKITVFFLILSSFTFSLNALAQGQSGWESERSTECPTRNELVNWASGASGDLGERIDEFREGIESINAKLSSEEQISEAQIMQLAGGEVCATLVSMRIAQDDAWRSFDGLEERLQTLPKNDPRRNIVGGIMGDSQRFGSEAREAWEDITAPVSEKGKTKVEALDYFIGLIPEQHMEVSPSMGGSLPVVSANDTFNLAHQGAKELLSQAYQAMVTPAKPENVPDGDLIEDFIPRIIRLAFRFAWFAVFISFIVTGAIFVIGASKEEWLEKAKTSTYYTVIGFAIVALSFAIVKAVTDIDFFRFI